MTIDRNKIILIMARKAWTYDDLAKAYGCSRQRIAVIMNSQRIQAKTAGKIAAALRVDVTEILANE